MTCYCNKLPFAHEHIATKKASEPVVLDTTKTAVKEAEEEDE
jgi:hypothetical protein